MSSVENHIIPTVDDLVQEQVREATRESWLMNLMFWQSGLSNILLYFMSRAVEGFGIIGNLASLGLMNIYLTYMFMQWSILGSVSMGPFLPVFLLTIISTGAMGVGKLLKEKSNQNVIDLVQSDIKSFFLSQDNYYRALEVLGPERIDAVFYSEIRPIQDKLDELETSLNDNRIAIQDLAYLEDSQNKTEFLDALNGEQITLVTEIEKVREELNIKIRERDEILSKLRAACSSVLLTDK